MPPIHESAIEFSFGASSHRANVNNTLPQTLIAATTAAPAAAITKALSSGVMVLNGAHLNVGAVDPRAVDVRRTEPSGSGNSGARPMAVSVGGRPGGRGGWRTAAG